LIPSSNYTWLEVPPHDVAAFTWLIPASIKSYNMTPI
jgi:hypothetical protein